MAWPCDRPVTQADTWLSVVPKYDLKRKLLTFPALLNSLSLGNWHACPRRGEANAASQLMKTSF